MVEHIKNHVLKFILKELIGKYVALPGPITTNLTDGVALFRQLELKSDVINVLAAEHDLPFQLVSSNVNNLKVNLPYKSLLRDPITIDAHSIELVVRHTKTTASTTTTNTTQRHEASRPRSPMDYDSDEELLRNEELRRFLGPKTEKSSSSFEAVIKLVDKIIGQIRCSCDEIKITVLCATTSEEETTTKSSNQQEISLTLIIKNARYSRETNTDSVEPDDMECSYDSAIVKYKLSYDSVEILLGEQCNTDEPESINVEYCLPIAVSQGPNEFQFSQKIGQDGSRENRYTLNLLFGDIRAIVTPHQMHLLGSFLKNIETTASSTHMSMSLTHDESESENENDMFYSAQSINDIGINGGQRFTANTENCNASQMNWTQCDTASTTQTFMSMKTSPNLTPSTHTYKNQFDDTESMHSSCSGFSSMYQQNALAGTSQIDASAKKFTVILLYDDIQQKSVDGALIEQTHMAHLRLAKHFLEAATDDTKIKEQNHIRLCANVIKSSSAVQHDTIEDAAVTISKFDFTETVDGALVRLIAFDRSTDVLCQVPPDVEFEIRPGNMNHSSTEIVVRLQKFSMDFDVSICDRLSAFLVPITWKDVKTTKSRLSGNSRNQRHKSNKIDFSLTVSSLLSNIKLRFPKVDMRSTDWRQRCLHHDYLIVALPDFNMHCNRENATLTASSVEVVYEQGNLLQSLPILNCRASTPVKGQKQRFPTISVTYGNDCSLHGGNNNKHNADNLYFKKSCFNSNEEMSGTRDFIVPNESEKIREFCENALRSASIQIEISSPHAKIVLLNDSDLNDRTIEVLYNRINTSWLLWKPKSPNLVELLQPKNARNVRNARPPTRKHRNFIKLALDIKVDKIESSIFVPVFNTNDDNIVLNALGKVAINGAGLHLFIAPEYQQNREENNYVCLQVDSFGVQHCGELPAEACKDAAISTEQYMQPVFYRNSGHFHLMRSEYNRQKSLALIVKVEKDTEMQLKRFKTTACFAKSILRYNPTESQNWLLQLFYFFNLRDYDVEGYKPYDVLSEIQLHFWDSAIEYRRDTCPYRAFLSMGTLAVCTNTTTAVKSGAFRFIIEDAHLLIALNNENVKQQDDLQEPEDLVSVFQLGTADLSIQRQSPEIENETTLDIRSTFHDGVLRVCSDSAVALLKLLQDIKTAGHSANDSATNESDEEETEIYVDPEEHQRIEELVHDALSDPLRATETNAAQAKREEVSKSIEEDLFFCERTALNTLKSPQEKLRSDVAKEFGDIFIIEGESSSDEDEFVFVPESNIEHRFKEIEILNEPLLIVDNHFSVNPNDLQQNPLNAPSDYPIPQFKYTMCEFSIKCCFYGGNDFPNKRENAAPKKKPTVSKEVMSDAYMRSVPYTYVSKKKHDYTRGGLKRQLDKMVELEIKNLRYVYELYPEETLQSSRHVLLIGRIEARDCVSTSLIHKMFYHPNSKIHSKNRENILNVKVHFIRPKDLRMKPFEECSLSISILPVKLNIEQNTLLFLDSFFSAVRSELTAGGDDESSDYDSDEQSDVPLSNSNSKQSLPGSHIFFREVKFQPAFRMRVDYEGTDFNSSKGLFMGIIMWLVKLKGSEIVLNQKTNRNGILGVKKLIDYFVDEWQKDIKNQLPKIFSGVAPIKPFVEIGRGSIDIIRLPILEYRRTGMITRGILMGMQSFFNRSLYAMLDVASGAVYLLQMYLDLTLRGYGVKTLRSLHLNQFAAQTTFEAISITPSRRYRAILQHCARRQPKPKDFGEGCMSSYLLIKEGMTYHALNLIEGVQVGHDHLGLAGAVGAVARHIPQTFVTPIVLSTQAVTNVIDGAKNSLIPEAKEDAIAKWKPNE